MNIQQILQCDLKLPPTPQVLPKLQAILRNENSSVMDVISVVKVDASLTAKVVSLSNSAYYGAVDPCQSLEEAVSRIGIEETYRVVSMAVANEAFGQSLPVYGIGEGELLENSIVAAVLMTEIATRKPWFNPDVGYTLGLLHSLGKVAVNEFLLEHAADHYDPVRDGPLDYAAEHALLGFNFTDVGAAVLRKWNFSDEVCDPIQYQFNPLEAPADNKGMSCALTMAISAIYIIEQEEEQNQQIQFEGDPEIMAEIPITPDELTECVECAREAFQDIRELLASF